MHSGEVPSSSYTNGPYRPDVSPSQEQWGSLFDSVGIDEGTLPSASDVDMTSNRGNEQSKAAEFGKKIGNFFKKGAGALLMSMASVKGSESLAKKGKELKGETYELGDGMRAKAKRLEKEADKLEKAGSKARSKGRGMWATSEHGTVKESAGDKLQTRGEKMQLKAKVLKEEAKHVREDAGKIVSDDVEGGPSLAKQRMRAAIGKMARGLGLALNTIGKKVRGDKFEGSETDIATTVMHVDGKNKRIDAKVKIREAQIDKKYKEGVKYINSLKIPKERKERLKGQLKVHADYHKSQQHTEYKGYLTDKWYGRDVSKPTLDFDPKALINNELLRHDEAIAHVENEAYRAVDKLVAGGKLTEEKGSQLKYKIYDAMNIVDRAGQKPKVSAKELVRVAKDFNHDANALADMISGDRLLPGQTGWAGERRTEMLSDEYEL